MGAESPILISPAPRYIVSLPARYKAAIIEKQKYVKNGMYKYVSF